MNTPKYVRIIQSGGNAAFALYHGQSVETLTAAPWFDGKPTGSHLTLDVVQFLAPTAPTKIVCVGLNYHAHVTASQSADKPPDKPLIFLKPPSSLIGAGATILYPAESNRLDYEAELGLVVGKRARNVSVPDALKYVFGWTCVNDVTARDLQKLDGQWTRAKGFDTFCPVGPWIIPAHLLDHTDLLVEGILNGSVLQSGRTSQMIFPIPFLISYISHIMTLEPGDLISTGTPAGISPMNRGDTIVVRVEGVGELSNVVA